MSIKIGLWLENFPNPALEIKSPGIGDFTRLFCYIRFKTNTGWSDSMQAIVDTGAPVSLIPLDVWSEAETEILTDFEIGGINPRQECTLPVLVGKIKCMLVDENREQSKELEIPSYFATTNKVPLLIGFKNLLCGFKMNVDPRGECYLLQIED
jgi:hypothetical protein